MAAYSREVGSQNVYIGVFIPDATVSTGAGLANVSSATVSLSWWRNDMAAVSVQQLTTGTLGTWAASSMVQMNSTLALGWYGVSLPNAMFLSGSASIAHIYAAANMAPVPISFDLTTHAAQNVVNPVGVSTITVGVNASTVSGLVGVSTVTIPVGVSSISVSVNASTVSGLVGVSSVTIPIGVSSISTPVTASSVTAGVNVTSNANLVGVSTLTIPVGVSSLSVSVNASTVSGLVGVSTNTDKTGYALTAGERASIADRLLGRNVSSGGDGGRTVAEALYVLRNKVDAGAGVVYMTDDSTSSWAFSVSTLAGNPIVAIDPA